MAVRSFAVGLPFRSIMARSAPDRAPMHDHQRFCKPVAEAQT